MYNLQSIKELLNALALGKELLGEMFSKRKSFDYRYSQAVELIEQNTEKLCGGHQQHRDGCYRQQKRCGYFAQKDKRV